MIYKSTCLLNVACPKKGGAPPCGVGTGGGMDVSTMKTCTQAGSRALHEQVIYYIIGALAPLLLSHFYIDKVPRSSLWGGGDRGVAAVGGGIF
jgi:hypothetical protein